MTLSLALMEPSNLDNVPEEFDGVLDCASLAICCSFNRKGSLLAVGCNDGRLVIWDFLTRGVAKNIPAHANHPICSVSWSRDGHKIVSASLDNTIAIWQVLTGDCLMRWRFPSPILKTQFNPRNDRLVLVCPLKHQSILVGVDYNQSSIDYKILPIDKDDPDLNIISSFDRRGQYIYTGNAKGRISIFKCPKSLVNGVEPELVSSFRIQTAGSTPASIREIEFGARNKTHFLVNSSDRTIRLFSCNSALKAGINGSCEEVRKFQDLVNKTMWRRCCFSGDVDASYVCGGSARQHALHIWESENGAIKKMLQGTKGELLLDVQWHPLRPIVASISSGLISIWSRPQIENWSAFAPDFQELEENIEYDERESEFDLEDEDNHPNNKRETTIDEFENVDVTEVKAEAELISSDEEEVDPNSLEFIPITLEDYEMVDATQTEVPYTQPLKEEPIKEARKNIDIKLENPPVDEVHPLSLGSSKRIRVNDKLNNSRKIPRQN